MVHASVAMAVVKRAAVIAVVLAGVLSVESARAQERSVGVENQARSLASGGARARWERVGRSRSSLRRVCDLRALGGSLYGAHANVPLDSDGATVIRYTPGVRVPFTVAFDWNRPGQPRAGGGGGQGFLRVREIDGRLFVPDADPPYAGLGTVDPGAEGYVFVSDREGNFAQPRGERARPPRVPDATGRAGAGVLPRAYHVMDVARWNGLTVASTGSVPPRERAWRGPSPGALHVADANYARWTYAVDYPFPYRAGVWRLTFMAAFGSRLFAGLQDYDGREPNDFVVFSPAPTSQALDRSHLSPRRVSSRGGALTLRWYVDTPTTTLYWIAIDRDGTARLRASHDGDHWSLIALPPDSGPPTDVLRWRGSLKVLTSAGLYERLADGGFALVAQAPSYRTRRGVRSHFALDDVFCAAPLGVLGDELFAGSQHDGSLWRLTLGP